MARWVAGKGGFAQAVDDLADELSQPATATALRSWAAATLAAQREREVAPASIRYPDMFPCIEAADIAPPPVFAHYAIVFGAITPVTHLHRGSERARGCRNAQLGEYAGRSDRDTGWQGTNASGYVI